MDGNETSARRGSGSWRRAATLAVGLAMLAPLGGCTADETTPGEVTESGAGVSAPPVEPLDVTGAAVSFEGGHAETPCFSFDVSPDVEYVLSPYAEGCLADVGWRGGDALTQIAVRAQSGDFSPEGTTAALEEAGIEALDVSTISVDGRDAARIDFNDAFGLRTTAVVIPLPPGRYFEGGVELTAVFVSAKTYDSDLEDLLFAVVTSLDVHE